MSKMILSITLLLLLCLCSNSAADSRTAGKKTQCCTRVSLKNISKDIKGNNYQNQTAHGECVNAIIFRTKKGGRRVCVDPNAAWVKKQIASMTQVEVGKV
ncbi:chemokine (C-C motif) ligand 34b, duplicate 4 [Scomber japonicus]|uniref:chemokine (C-C motif) ligand 34b, duplicate 4 n=1 Tax=Scomber japonicus TaxID=13676 RepID=UPI00230641A5|nr:chemokine (C-C motif) ligand 34b, duplicate 4 [Scomber japonicus]